MKKPPKPFKTFDEQIELLLSRNLIIDDEHFAKNILSNINYYRFINAYDLEFIDKSTNNTYCDNLTFENLYDIYDFDKSLRHCLFSSIETIEIRFRTILAYCFGKKYGALGYLDKLNYKGSFDFDRFQTSFQKEKECQHETSFVKHHEQYEEMPIWVAVEMLSFGCLSNMFKYMKNEDKEEIVSLLLSQTLKKPKLAFFDNWMNQLVKIRNICAHYGRLYNRKMDNPNLDIPDPKLKSILSKPRLFSMLIPIMKLLDDKLKACNLKMGLESVIIQYPTVDIWKLGFPKQWKTILDDTIKGNI